jgi:hypothetical protein
MLMKIVKTRFFAVATLTLLAIGCGSESTEVSVATYDSSQYILDAEPSGAIEVAAARESAQDKEEVVIVGRIGGSLDPWVKGRAAFSIVDNAILACSDDKEEGEPCSCKTPWDYCCEVDKLPNAMALVKFVDSSGVIVKHDAKANFGVKELDTVIIKGTAERDDAGNLTVLASGMFVRK